MKLGAYTACLHDLPLPDALKTLADMGLVGIAVSPSGYNNCHRYMPELTEAVSRGVRAAGVTHPARPARAVDSTGAGDAFAAGYLLGGVGLGLAAAARAVATMGAMP